MFSKILVPVDGSDTSFRAFDAALFLSGKLASQVTAVHVMDKEPSMYVPTDNYVDSLKMLDELRGAYESEEQKMLTKYSQLAERKGITTNSVLLEGDPASVILNYARKENYDVIIMGNRGLSSFKKLVVGSVSDKILHNSPCPVILIK